jgi:hypothetical protein
MDLIRMEIPIGSSQPPTSTQGTNPIAERLAASAAKLRTINHMVINMEVAAGKKDNPSDAHLDVVVRRIERVWIAEVIAETEATPLNDHLDDLDPGLREAA